jgi:uncharacterized protein with PQ loop repeat
VTAHDIAPYLAYAGSAAGIAMVVPQIQRIARNPKMAGVSPWTWALMAMCCSLWVTYGVRMGSLPQMPGNALLSVGAVLVVLLVPAAWSRTTRAAVLAAAVAVLILVTTVLSPVHVGFLAFGVGVAALFPQAYETLWVRRGQGPSALSLTSTAMRAAAQSLWLGFAVLSGDFPVLASSLLALSVNATVSIVEARRRRGVVPAPVLALPASADAAR